MVRFGAVSCASTSPRYSHFPFVGPPFTAAEGPVPLVVGRVARCTTECDNGHKLGTLAIWYVVGTGTPRDAGG